MRAMFSLSPELSIRAFLSAKLPQEADYRKSFTSEGFTLIIPDTENPMNEKLKVPVYSFHSSWRLRILSPKSFFISPK